MSGTAHDLRCSNDPCECERVYVVHDRPPTGEAVGYNDEAEVAAKSHTVESRGPAGELPLSGGALRVTGGRQ